MRNEPEAPSGADTTLGVESLSLSGLWYTPTTDEIDQVKAYLAEMEASINLLPELEPVADGLDIGYDPSWREVPK